VTSDQSDKLDGRLDPAGVAADPLEQFRLWFDQAVAAGVPEPEAMFLATVDDGVPTGRTVLLKGVSDAGFRFFTNYSSPKARQLEDVARAALGFRWELLDRQVRVEGTVSRLSPADSDSYFAGRPRGSQIGAWASRQSEPLADRATLEARVAEIEDRFGGREIPRPPWWGGLVVRPEMVEFWQGRPDRLHDRVRYLRAEGSGPGDQWEIGRLYP
jgi:pyridoxamine 5'-phosphate oxidase